MTDVRSGSGTAASPYRELAWCTTKTATYVAVAAGAYKADVDVSGAKKVVLATSAPSPVFGGGSPAVTVTPATARPVFRVSQSGELHVFGVAVENQNAPKSIEGKTQFLILEALRRIDEEQQGGEKTDEEG